MLDPQVQEAWLETPKLHRDVQLINLSRGLLAMSHIPPGSEVHPIRIPSTWCEQKHWGKILDTLGPTFWILAAEGQRLTVHDISERMRPTRALWQGLSWIRFAVNAAWDLPMEPELSRSGMRMDDYWEKVFHSLPETTRAMMRYWLNYYKGDGEPLRLQGCDTCWKGNTGG